MKPTASLDILIAQIQIQFEHLASLVVTSPLRQKGVERVAERIVDGLRVRGMATILYLPATDGPSDPDVRSDQSESKNVPADTNIFPRVFTPAQAGTPRLARSLLATPGIVTVAAAPGVLEDPSALFLATAADAVLLVAEAGITARADLRRARLELESAGARLVGAVLAE